MSNVNYTDAPADIDQALAGSERIEDFIPRPEELVKKADKEKITIAIDKHSLDLYKKYAKSHNAKYQTMINSVVGAYAEKFLKK